MKQKFYVEDMFNGKIIYAANEEQAALIFLEYKMADNWQPRDRRIAQEYFQAEFLLFTERILISRLGFVQRVRDICPEREHLNKTVFIKTKGLLNQLGMQTIADLLSGRNHTSQFDTQELGKTYILRLG